MRFHDRRDAGRQLAAALQRLSLQNPVILGIPRGGVVVSAEIAAALDAPHGVVVARKLGAPDQPELAIGAVTANGVAYVDEELARLTGADEGYLQWVMREEAEEARRRESRFAHDRRPPLAGRTIVIVDDGIATGATAIAAVRDVKAQGATRVIVAVPIGPPDTIARLRQEADDVVCLGEEPDFFAVGEFYDQFDPVEDDSVVAILDATERARGTTRA